MKNLIQRATEMKKKCDKARPNPKFLSILLVVCAQFFLVAPALAICEQELNAWISANDRKGIQNCKEYPNGCRDGYKSAAPQMQQQHSNNTKPGYKQFYRPGEAEKFIESQEQNLTRAVREYNATPAEYKNSSTSGLHKLTWIAEIKYRICLAKGELSSQASPVGATQSESKPSGVDSGSQAAQQQAQQTQQLAAQNQARADQARQGKRKTHDPAAEAHECISIDPDPGLFGAFKNTCSYKVNFNTCNYKPRVRSGGFNWSADFDCEQQKFGLHTPDGGRAVASHNRNTEMVYWFACKAPAFPVDGEFTVGRGIQARCN